MQRVGPRIAESVFAACRYDHRLIGARDMTLVFHPDFGIALHDRQDFLDRVQVSGRSLAGVAPLLEHAKLRRAGEHRYAHPRPHPFAPYFARLLLVG